MHQAGKSTENHRDAKSCGHLHVLDVGFAHGTGMFQKELEHRIGPLGLANKTQTPF